MNNVGVLKKISFLNDDPGFIQTSIKVNLHPFFLYTKFAINSFYKQAESLDDEELAKRRFGILQVVSLSFPRPYVFAGMYGSNKRMCGNFATIINKQHKQNIDSLILNPGPVSTQMIGYSKNPYTTCSPEETI